MQCYDVSPHKKTKGLKMPKPILQDSKITKIKSLTFKKETVNGQETYVTSFPHPKDKTTTNTRIKIEKDIIDPIIAFLNRKTKENYTTEISFNVTKKEDDLVKVTFSKKAYDLFMKEKKTFELTKTNPHACCFFFPYDCNGELVWIQKLPEDCQNPIEIVGILNGLIYRYLPKKKSEENDSGSDINRGSDLTSDSDTNNDKNTNSDSDDESKSGGNNDSAFVSHRKNTPPSQKNELSELSKLFIQYFPAERFDNETTFRPMRFLKTDWGSFIIASFIRTPTDYENWLSFYKLWYKRPRKKGLMRKDPLDEDFFSPENMQKQQTVVEAPFKNKVIPIHHIQEPEHDISPLLYFKWSAAANCYEFQPDLPSDKSQRKEDPPLFYGRQCSLLNDALTRDGSNVRASLCLKNNGKFSVFQLFPKDYNYARSRLERLLCNKLTKKGPPSEKLPFTRCELPTGEVFYLNCSQTSLRKKIRLKKQFGITQKSDTRDFFTFTYKDNFLIFLSESLYKKRQKGIHCSEKYITLNNEKCTELLNDSNFLIPHKMNLTPYLAFIKTVIPEHIFLNLKKALTFFDNKKITFSETTQFAGYLKNNNVGNNLHTPLYNQLTQLLFPLIESQLFLVTPQVELAEYQHILREQFRQISPSMTTTFCFPLALDQSKIQLQAGTEIDNLISVFIKNGHYHLEITAPPIASDTTKQRTKAVHLIKLLLAVTQANALIHEKQTSLSEQENPPPPKIVLTAQPTTKEIADYRAQKSALILKTINAKRNGQSRAAQEDAALIFTSEQIEQSKAWDKKTLPDIEKFERHLVVADAPTLDIGHQLFLLAGDEDLRVEKGKIITFGGQGVVVDAGDANQLIKDGKVSSSEFADYDRHSTSAKAGRVIWFHGDPSSPERGPGYFINHTSDNSQQNVVIKHVDDSNGLASGFIFVAIRDFSVPKGTAVPLLTSYGKSKDRLFYRHGIEVSSEQPLSEPIPIRLLTGVTQIDKELEELAWQQQINKIDSVRSMLARNRQHRPVVEQFESQVRLPKAKETANPVSNTTKKIPLASVKKASSTKMVSSTVAIKAVLSVAPPVLPQKQKEPEKPKKHPQKHSRDDKDDKQEQALGNKNKLRDLKDESPLPAFSIALMGPEHPDYFKYHPKAKRPTWMSASVHRANNRDKRKVNPISTNVDNSNNSTLEENFHTAKARRNSHPS